MACIWYGVQAWIGGGLLQLFFAHLLNTDSSMLTLHTRPMRYTDAPRDLV